MKNKAHSNKLIITLTIAALILFLKKINVLQSENKLGYPLPMIGMTLFFSGLAIFVQKQMDDHFSQKTPFYEHLDVLKYVMSILIIILHLRPFLGYSNELDLTFNNIITRICVPIFFLITGYFTAQKEKQRPNYIHDYIKKSIPLYLTWSAIYLPILLPTIWPYLAPIPLPLLILLAPLALLVALLYSGVYYHLWYFPALFFSLLLLSKWKQKWPVQWLLLISFVLLLFGATETYWGIIPTSIQEWLAYYYHIFFTTRNCLFFGLFYVVLGYMMGQKKALYTPYCLEKLILSIFFLIFEAILLHDTDRLNSNILLSCIPLVYYLFIATLYFPHIHIQHFPFRTLSKYYYLLHPFIIYVTSQLLNPALLPPFTYLLIIFILTHLTTLGVIYIKKKYPSLTC